MALRAGYYGLKNSVKRTLEKLASDMAGAKIIKTIGDGLTLSDQGALAANIDSDTMEFKNHKLAAKITSGFTKDLLYGSSTITYPAIQVSEITLLKNEQAANIGDYDFLYIVSGWLDTGVKCVQTWFMPCDVLLQTDTPTADTDFIFAFPCNAGTSSGGQWIRIGKGDANNKLSIRYNKGGGSGVLGPGIYQVYGVKF